MTWHRTRLKRLADQAWVDAELHDALSLDDLLAAEAQWAEKRVDLVRRLVAAGVPNRDWPQHCHWN